MNYFIKLQGTCWLIQYLNYLGIKYDKNIFYKYLAINRYIRYSKAINLVKEKKIISNKPYLIETLLTFEGSLFDIEDILNYDVIGDLKSDIKIDEIFNYNEKVLMLLLKMFDSGVDLSNEIMNCLQDTFGMISFNRKSDNKNLTILTSDKNFDYKKINLKIVMIYI